MTAKTQKNKRGHNKTYKRVSKRVLEMQKDPTTVWGKNKPLETFWRGLASSKYVVVVYKNGTYKYIKLPNPHTQKSTKLYNEFDENAEIDAVLSSNLSQDAYEIYLYPKAKDHSVEYVIKNYKKYFKNMEPNKNDMEGYPLMKKVVFPN
jgi:hypothetical protein